MDHRCERVQAIPVGWRDGGDSERGLGSGVLRADRVQRGWKEVVKGGGGSCLGG